MEKQDAKNNNIYYTFLHCDGELEIAWLKEARIKSVIIRKDHFGSEATYKYIVEDKPIFCDKCGGKLK